MKYEMGGNPEPGGSVPALNVCMRKSGMTHGYVLESFIRHKLIFLSFSNAK